jgi:glutamyl-tRNA reductase
LAATLRADVVSFEDCESRLSDWDVVVCSTSAPGTVISAAAVREAMKARAARPLLLVDLAMPRDVEAAAGKVGNVFLYNLDDLALIAEKNRRARLAEVDRARIVLAPRIALLWQQVRMQLASGAEGRSGAPAASAPGPAFSSALCA